MISSIKSFLLKKCCSTVGRYELWNKTQHEAWQFARFKKLLRQAERHVPYYRRQFHEIGFGAHDFNSIQDIETIPFTTKEDILSNGPNAFCDDRIPHSLRSHGNTGGSSGTPCPLLKFRPFSHLWEKAFMIQQWGRVGYKSGDRIGVLRGPVVFDKKRIYDWKENEGRLILSTYDLSPERVEQYIGALNEYKITFLHVYPTSLALFIDYMRRLPNRIALPYLRGVLAGSEGLLPSQQELCEKALGVPCYHWYGHSEDTLMGGWCEHTEMFHFFPQYGYLELIDDDRKRLMNSNEIGELVGTGFCNPAMILIRYRTGDLGSGLRWEGCLCGREFPTLDQIHGRSHDYIVASDGCKVPVTALMFGLHLPIFNHYRKVQLEQSEPGIVTVRLESYKRISHVREIELSKTSMEEALRGRLSVSFEDVDTIPVMANGKHQFVIQHLLDPSL